MSNLNIVRGDVVLDAQLLKLLEKQVGTCYDTEGNPVYSEHDREDVAHKLVGVRMENGVCIGTLEFPDTVPGRTVAELLRKGLVDFQMMECGLAILPIQACPLNAIPLSNEPTDPQ